MAQELLPLAEFHARLTALQLSNPGTAALYALHAARVNFIPYQFRPVLKFIHADRPRLLIADEVGVGKTIEAGLILRELQARREVRSVLVICPKPLVTERKWYSELRRFDEEFEHLDGEKLRLCLRETDLEGQWPDRYAKAIIPFSLFDERLLQGDGQGRRRIPGLLDLDPAPRFDLVIVDEAHAIRNSATQLHQGVRFLCDHADAVVFLTATPIQLGVPDLFTLLNVLRPDLVIDPASFEHMTAPNPHLNRASALARQADTDWQMGALLALEAAAATPWGEELLRPNPEHQRLVHALHSGEISRAERVAFIRDVERMHTLGHVISRTRRRDIGKFFTTRKPETVRVSFTPEQKEVHDRLLAAQGRILAQLYGGVGVSFMLSTLRRQAASSISGLAPLIRDILSRRIGELEWDELGAEVEPIVEIAPPIAEEIAEVLSLAEALSGPDPKLDALRQVIRDKQQLPNNKLLLFSSFRHTLRYLADNLALEDVRMALVHGGTPEEERRDFRHRFSLPRDEPEAIDVLLSSEVGSEGLDYQFCDSLVNYDLPWNPMRIEQRIGRLDRYGQESDVVVIYNLVTQETVDAAIYDRCLSRIGIFEEALGGSEEILGRIGQGMRRIAEDLTLSEEERAAQLQQLADNEVRVLQEQILLENQQGALFGITLPPSQVDEDVHDATSAGLSPDALLGLAKAYLAGLEGGDAALLGTGPKHTLRASQPAREELLRDFRQLPASRSPVHREWERWLKGGDPHVALTFESEYATRDRSTPFITPVHPFAQQAAKRVSTGQVVRVAFRVPEGAIPPGTYPFAIYQWESHGLRNASVLQPVCGEPALQDAFFDLLAAADAVAADEVAWPDAAAFDQLEALHYASWTRHREEHRAETLRLAGFRRESLRRSHEGRMALLEQQLGAATHENIRRMRRAQAADAGAEYAIREAEIDAAERSVDVVSHPVALGCILVAQGEAGP